MWPWLHHSSHFFGSPESRPGRSLCPPRHLKLGTLRQREWHRPCSAEPRPRFDSRLPIDAHAATQHNTRGAYVPPLEARVHPYRRWPRTTRRASCLSISPMFFAAHLHSGWRGLETPSLKFCELPSRARRQHFATFHYHRSLIFPAIEKPDYKLLRQSNIPRKVIVFPPIQARRLGLAQHCCSVLVMPEKKDFGWLGMYHAHKKRLHDSNYTVS